MREYLNIVGCVAVTAAVVILVCFAIMLVQIVREEAGGPRE